MRAQVGRQRQRVDAVADPEITRNLLLTSMARGKFKDIPMAIGEGLDYDLEISDRLSGLHTNIP